MNQLTDLVGQLRFHFLLETTQEERSQHFVQTSDDEDRLLFVEFHFLAGGGERSVEPLLERRHRLEDGRQQKVEKRPQLGQLVLQRRSRQQQAVWSQIVRVQHLIHHKKMFQIHL